MLLKCLPKSQFPIIIMLITMKWFNNKNTSISLLDLKLKLHHMDSHRLLSTSKKTMMRMTKKRCPWVNSQHQTPREKWTTTMMMSLQEAMDLSNNSRYKCSKWSNIIKLNNIEASIENLQSRVRDRLSWQSSRWKESGKSNSINNNWHKDANKKFKNKNSKLKDVHNKQVIQSY